MEEAISFFRAFEFWIYAILGLGAIIYVRKFVLSWRELNVATFGLERENAQSQLNQSASMLVFVLILAVAEFVLVTYIAPSMPSASPLPTPTIDYLATTTSTLPAATTQTVTATSPSTIPTNNPGASGCIPQKIMISSPLEGDIVNGVVEITGTANIPGFGFYKLEMKRPDEDIWATFQAGDKVTIESKLGAWDTRLLTPGVYQIGLVVVDNEAKFSDPCVVQVNVTLSPDETLVP